ncbi:alpha/beta fold hydrolase [Streptomyces acidicola]|uniref:Alpha/beta hydrolase n=1 Tax=Streptomyces acidicola TaxID=2596892 RepID=A0A5N8X1M5_9ACTN|nr:alpha/beta hydrolase [Streptomyces acidicola]MPY53487.1 alpha/beta hydrolase [Streptomyces acidicola]
MTDVSQVFTFPSDDGLLAYRDTGGAGPPLVLLHGGFTDHRMWDDVVPLLAVGHRVIAPDARGHGASDNASRPFRFADDLAALLRHLDVVPAVLVGMSMGSAIAVDTALEHPGLVRALAVSGAGTSEPEYRDPWTKDFGVRRQAALEAGDIEGWVDASLSAVAGPHRTLDEVDPDVVRRVRDMLLGTITKHAPGEPDWSVPVTDTWARAAGITVPVLAVNGALDASDLIAMADRLVDIVAGDSRTTAIEGTAHYANMERPDTFTKILLEWLGSITDQPLTPDSC